jgi:hypothetical protein
MISHKLGTRWPDDREVGVIPCAIHIVHVEEMRSTGFPV